MITRTKKALVTGAGKRIGAAIVRDLAAHGFDVAIHYQHSKAEAEELALELGSLPVKISTLQADLTSETATKSLFRQALEQIGPIDLLVNKTAYMRHLHEEMRAEVCYKLPKNYKK